MGTLSADSTTLDDIIVLIKKTNRSGWLHAEWDPRNCSSGVRDRSLRERI